MRLRQQLGLGLAKSHRTTGPALHLAHEEYPDTENNQHWQPGNQNADKRCRTIRFRTRRYHNVFLCKLADQLRITGRIGLEGSTIVGIGAGNTITGNGDGFHLAIGHVLQEARIFNLC